MDRGYYVDYIIPTVEMRAREEYIRRTAKDYPVLEPFAPRHSISYFNNYKEDSARSAFERLHNVDGYDPKRVRCDRVDPRLHWLEISKENQGHKVPMTGNLWYGRPNRVQYDFIPKKFNRSSKMQEFFTSCGITYISADEQFCE